MQTARNVMIKSSATSPVRMAAKLADMTGVCACIKQQRTSTTTTTATTGTSSSKLDSNTDSTPGSSTLNGAVRELSHVAPERLRNPDGSFGLAQDVYSFGILMWEVFTGQQAYRKLRDAQHLYEAIVIQNLRPKIPDGECAQGLGGWVCTGASSWWATAPTWCAFASAVQLRACQGSHFGRCLLRPTVSMAAIAAVQCVSM